MCQMRRSLFSLSGTDAVPDADVAGILSSPWLENKVKVNCNSYKSSLIPAATYSLDPLRRCLAVQEIYLLQIKIRNWTVR